MDQGSVFLYHLDKRVWWWYQSMAHLNLSILYVIVNIKSVFHDFYQIYVKQFLWGSEENIFYTMTTTANWSPVSGDKGRISMAGRFNAKCRYLDWVGGRGVVVYVSLDLFKIMLENEFTIWGLLVYFGIFLKDNWQNIFFLLKRL